MDVFQNICIYFFFDIYISFFGKQQKKMNKQKERQREYTCTLCNHTIASEDKQFVNYNCIHGHMHLSCLEERTMFSLDFCRLCNVTEINYKLTIKKQRNNNNNNSSSIKVNIPFEFSVRTNYDITNDIKYFSTTLNPLTDVNPNDIGRGKKLAFALCCDSMRSKKAQLTLSSVLRTESASAIQTYYNVDIHDCEHDSLEAKYVKLNISKSMLDDEKIS